MKNDIVCFSPLKWDAGYHRPHQILSRCARQQRVFYVEAPEVHSGPVQISIRPIQGCSLWVITPKLPDTGSIAKNTDIQRMLIEQFVEVENIRDFILWIYSPSALKIASRLSPSYIVYDCLSSQLIFDPEEKLREAELMHKADLVFTDGQKAFKCDLFSIQQESLFPGSIDIEHFLQARNIPLDPIDQFEIPHPRLGFFGVINQCFDTDLLIAVADRCPEWHIILLGPMVNIDPYPLLSRKNIHYLSNREYIDLPAYLAHWDVAILPDKRKNFPSPISASQIPQYLAGGCPVVSTAIPSVSRCYGASGLVWLADSVEEFINGVKHAIASTSDRSAWRKAIDSKLPNSVWEQAWEWMQQGFQSLQTRQHEIPGEVLASISH
jgi:UDP-galactopyranose mutase